MAANARKAAKYTSHTLGYFLALHVSPANEQERAQVKQLSKEVQETTFAWATHFR